MIRGLIFDFDGLILETEWPVFQSWKELYQEYNCKLDLDWWGTIIGAAPEDFDPFDDLEKRLGRPVDRTALAPRRLKRELELIEGQPVLPGVVDYLEAARRLGLKLAVASSSSRDWVAGHLERLGLLGYFDVIKTSDDVERAKPAPDLFLAALEALGLGPDEAVVFEDSPNGILAARRAGLCCVCIPNALTRQLDISQANLRLESFAELPLEELLERVNHRG